MLALPNSPYPRLGNEAGAAFEEHVSQIKRLDRGGEITGADVLGRIDQLIAHLQDRAATAPSAPTQESTGLEARIAHLEASSAHLQRDVAQIRTDIRDIRERLYRTQDRVANAPTRLFVAGSVLAMMAALAGATAFAPELQAVAERAVSASVGSLR